MLFVALLLTCLGLRTAQGLRNTDHLLQTREETLEKTRKALQSSSVLRLSMISYDLGSGVCTCLHSKFTDKLENGAKRTLECYVKENGINSLKEDYVALSTNVSAFVELEPTDPYAALNLYEGPRKLPDRWTLYYYSVIYAANGCFILRSTPGKTPRAPCVLFELDSANWYDKKDCSEKFQKKCESAFRTDNAFCQRIAKTAKKQYW